MTEVDLEEFGQQIADAVESFLVSLQAISREESVGSAVPLLLLEVSQVMLAGARLGVQIDFQPPGPYQPDVGPDPDLDDMRMRLAELLGDADTYSHNFDPYGAECLTSQLSDDLTAIATDLANGLKHFRVGNLEEALWWWQFSYQASWGTLGCGVLSALHSVISHDRVDKEILGEDEQIAAADQILG